MSTLNPARNTIIAIRNGTIKPNPAKTGNARPSNTAEIIIKEKLSSTNLLIIASLDNTDVHY